MHGRRPTRRRSARRWWWSRAGVGHAATATAGGRPYTCTRSIRAGIRSRGGPSKMVEAADVAASSSGAHVSGSVRSAVGRDPREQLAVAAAQIRGSPNRIPLRRRPSVGQGVHDVVRRQRSRCSAASRRTRRAPAPRRSSMSSSAAATALLCVSQPPSSAESSSSDQPGRQGQRRGPAAPPAHRGPGSAPRASAAGRRRGRCQIGRSGCSDGDGAQERIQNHCGRDDFGALHGMVTRVGPVVRSRRGLPHRSRRQLRSRPSGRRAGCDCRRHAHRGRREEGSACARNADAATA